MCYIDWCIHFLVFHILICHFYAMAVRLPALRALQRWGRPVPSSRPRLAAALRARWMAQVPAPPGPLTPPRTEEEMRRFIAEYDALTDFDRLWHARTCFCESLCESVICKDADWQSLWNHSVWDSVFQGLHQSLVISCLESALDLWCLAQGPQSCCWRSPGINGLENLQLQRRCLAWGSGCWWHPLAVAGQGTGHQRYWEAARRMGLTNCNSVSLQQLRWVYVSLTRLLHYIILHNYESQPIG